MSITLHWPLPGQASLGRIELDAEAARLWLAETYGYAISLEAAQEAVTFAALNADEAYYLRYRLDMSESAPVTPATIDAASEKRYRAPSPARTAGFVLAVACALPELRARLQRPKWRLLLDALAEQAPSDPRAQARPGWLELCLRSGYMRPQIVLCQQALRGTRMLKSKVLPTEGAIEAFLRSPTAAESEAWDCEQALLQQDAGYLERYLGDWQQRLLRQGPHLKVVSYNGAPIEACAEAWAPTLTVGDSSPGQGVHGADTVWVALGPEPAWIYTGAPDWVIVEGTLRPVLPEARSLVRLLKEGALSGPLKPADVPDFVSGVLARLSVPVELTTEKITFESGVPEPRLLISTEAFETIVVDVRFRYADLDVVPDHGAVLTQFDRLIRRDTQLESSFRGELESAVIAAGGEAPQTWPARLFEDAAWRFLTDLGTSFPDWRIEADKKLLKRLRGTASPQVRIHDKSDWFDLDISLVFDGQDLGIRRVLEAWRTQRQFVALKSGEVVQLPESWLAQHGQALEAIDDLRRSTGQKLGAPAAYLARDLLAELDPQAAAGAERWLEVGRRLQGVERVPERTVPEGLSATLRDYQHRGFRWLCFVRDLGLGGVLADDMGLGKTVQTLALLLDGRSPNSRPDLVVAPTSVIHNWVLEAERFAPSLTVHLHYGPKRTAPPKNADVVVTSYALLRRDEVIQSTPWRIAVLDEAQHIKNHLSAVSKAARALDAQHRFALSGTPMENNLSELWSIMGFVVPGLFGSQEGFARRYARPIAEGGEVAQARLTELNQRMRPFMLRRLKSEVATELPARQEQVLTVVLGTQQRRLYDGLRDAYRAEVSDLVETRGIANSRIKVLEALLRLRQAACEPALIPLAEAESVKTSAKRALLGEILPVLASEGHRSLIFSQWPRFLKAVGADLEAAGLKYLYLDGSTRHRGRLQAEWNHADGPPFFLISIKAGGTGLNLIAADHVFHLDPWWNPAVEQQATDRAHRIGQTKPVLVYKLVAQDTVEEKILALQAKKRALFDATVDADRVTVDSLSGDDLSFVFEGAAPTARQVQVAPLAHDSDEGLQSLLDSGQPLTAALVRERLDLSAHQARAKLAEWTAAGRLSKHGRGRGTHYLPLSQ